MASSATRWDLSISEDTDRQVRELLGRDPESLSHFVEDAVRARIFDITVERIKARNATVSAEDIQTTVDDALTWARRHP